MCGNSTAHTSFYFAQMLSGGKEKQIGALIFSFIRCPQKFSSWNKFCCCEVGVGLADKQPEFPQDDPGGPKHCRCQVGFIRSFAADPAAPGKAKFL